MKTSEKSVIVEVEVGGKIMRHIYPIVTGNGDLMTHRLKRLMAGRVGHPRSPHDGYEEAHFMGMVWKPPYQILQEILRDRIDLQSQLLAVEGKNNFTEIEPIKIPKKAENGKITTLVQEELKLRGILKARLKSIGTPDFNAQADIRPIAPPYGGWNVTD